MDRHVEDAQGIRLIGVERFLVRGGPARVGGIAGLEGVGPLAATLDFPQAVQGMVSGRDIEPVAKSPLDRGPVRQDVPLDHLQEEALREVVGLVFPDERHQADRRADRLVIRLQELVPGLEEFGDGRLEHGKTLPTA